MSGFRVAADRDLAGTEKEEAKRAEQRALSKTGLLATPQTPAAHALSGAAHTSALTPGKMVKAAATTGLPADATNTDAQVSAAVTASHSNANDPSAGQKAALAGTSGTPSVDNKYVTNDDSRNTNARAPTTHASSHNAGGGDALAIDAVAATGSLRTLGTAATAACAGNDSRLSDARTPTSHATSHVTGGSDIIANAVAAGNAGLMSGADKTKLDGITAGAAVASVSGTAPIVSSGGTTPAISISAASAAAAGSMSGDDKLKLDMLSGKSRLTFSLLLMGA